MKAKLRWQRHNGGWDLYKNGVPVAWLVAGLHLRGWDWGTVSGPLSNSGWKLLLRDAKAAAERAVRGQKA